ncbi:MAG: hypothetical protein HY841_11610 [Bacteroidetes bacterium]|nr:hypothetical protein [Bacteroidota bacterium]
MKKVFLMLMAAATIATIGCKKYPDGPVMSLSSKKGRVANTWKFEKVFEVASGAEYTPYYSDQYIEFKKEGTYIWTYGLSSYVGTWVFASDNADIVLTRNGKSTSDAYHIRKLKGKEFWFRDDVSPGFSVEFHLAPR